MNSRRRLVSVLLPLATVLLLAGCSGKTIAPNELTPDSAKLSAVVSCDNSNTTNPCSFFFRYYGYTKSAGCKDPSGALGACTVVRSATYTTPRQGPFTAKVTNVTVGKLLTRSAELKNYASLSYQLCGRGDNVKNDVCLGPDGTGNTWTSFTWPLSSPVILF